MASSQPPPSAYPVIAAIVGHGRSSTRWKSRALMICSACGSPAFAELSDVGTGRECLAAGA